MKILDALLFNIRGDSTSFSRAATEARREMRDTAREIDSLSDKLERYQEQMDEGVKGSGHKWAGTLLSLRAAQSGFSALSSAAAGYEQMQRRIALGRDPFSPFREGQASIRNAFDYLKGALLEHTTGVQKFAGQMAELASIISGPVVTAFHALSAVAVPILGLLVNIGQAIFGVVGKAWTFLTETIDAATQAAARHEIEMVRLGALITSNGRQTVDTQQKISYSYKATYGDQKEIIKLQGQLLDAQDKLAEDYVINAESKAKTPKGAAAPSNILHDQYKIAELQAKLAGAMGTHTVSGVQTIGKEGAAFMTPEGLDAMAKSLQSVTRFSDNAIMHVMSVLMTYNQVGTKQIPDVTKAVLNMAEAMGTDASEAAYRLGEALENPDRNMIALRRMGVAFTAEQEKQIKAWVESGQTMKADALMLEVIKQKYGDLAEAIGGTATGGLEIFHNQANTLLQYLGDRWLPLIETIFKGVNKAVFTFSEDIRQHGFVQAIMDAFIPTGQGGTGVIYNILHGLGMDEAGIAMLAAKVTDFTQRARSIFEGVVSTISYAMGFGPTDTTNQGGMQGKRSLVGASRNAANDKFATAFTKRPGGATEGAGAFAPKDNGTFIDRMMQTIFGSDPKTALDAVKGFVVSGFEALVSAITGIFGTILSKYGKQIHIFIDQILIQIANMLMNLGSSLSKGGMFAGFVGNQIFEGAKAIRSAVGADLASIVVGPGIQGNVAPGGGQQGGPAYQGSGPGYANATGTTDASQATFDTSMQQADQTDSKILLPGYNRSGVKTSRAFGGYMEAGVPSRVGERPEIFMPSTGGTMTNLSSLGAKVYITVNAVQNAREMFDDIDAEARRRGLALGIA